MMRLASISMTLATLGAITVAHGLTLDRQGNPGPPLAFVCEDLKLVTAGPFAAPVFDITFTARCAPLDPMKQIVGWDQLDWIPVTINGRYSAGLQDASEGITTQGAAPKLLVLSHTRCPRNPWIHPPSCELMSLTNNTVVDFDDPIPRSPYAMGHVVRDSLLLLEDQAEAAKAQPKGATGDPQFLTQAPTLLLPAPNEAFTGSVTIRVAPIPQFGSTVYPLEFEWLQSSPSAWIPKPVVPAINTSTFPNGMPVPKASFGQMGTWRVRAKNPYSGTATPWRLFELTPFQLSQIGPTAAGAVRFQVQAASARDPHLVEVHLTHSGASAIIVPVELRANGHVIGRAQVTMPPGEPGRAIIRTTAPPGLPAPREIEVVVLGERVGIIRLGAP